jgi:hypothetical protein
VTAAQVNEESTGDPFGVATMHAWRFGGEESVTVGRPLLAVVHLIC